MPETVVEITAPTDAEVAKVIFCPRCKRGIRLLAKDFEIETDTDGTWCASHSVLCLAQVESLAGTTPCGAEFWIVWSEIVWVSPPK